MPRTNPTLLSNIATPSVPGQTRWFPTEGYLNSVSAALKPGSVSATVEIYVANAGSGAGVKIASMNLSAANPSDGFSLPREDNGWFMVRAEVSAVNGEVQQVNACVGE